MTMPMKVDLLKTERQGLASFAEGDDFHTEHTLIERGRYIDVPDRQYQMIEMFNVHAYLRVQ
jgi:hypothetical protein